MFFSVFSLRESYYSPTNLIITMTIQHLTLTYNTTSITQHHNIVLHQIFIIHHHTYIQFKNKQQSHLTPHIKHHKPNYKARTPALPWIEGRSTISGLNLCSCRFLLIPAASRSSQSLFSSYCFLLLFLSHK